MRKTLIATAIAIPLFAANAHSSTPDVDKNIGSNGSLAALTQSQTAVHSSVNVWLPELMTQFEQLPEVRAQKVLMKQTKLALTSADNAIYNPELGLDYQNAPGDDTYSIAVSQTIDWSDKRGEAVRVAQLESEMVLASIELNRSQLLSQQLLALANLQQNQKLLAFNQQQFDSAQRQLALAKQRAEVGDISMVELQLMQLDVANNAADLAIAEQEMLNAETAVYGLLGPILFSNPSQSAEVMTHNLLNIDYLALAKIPSFQSVSPQLPALKSAYQQVMLTKLTVNQMKADLAEDPSISLSAEREGSDNKFAVGVSIPLQIRNNYSDAIATASEDISIAEQAYLVEERLMQQQWMQFNRAVPRLLQRYQQWEDLVQKSGQAASSALSTQWRSGDIATSDYLQSQQQMSSSYIAGLRLEASLYENWLAWMGNSGQLEQILREQLTSRDMTQSLKIAN
ncbi:transporter [Shewanella sp. 10N.286.52.C2]|nr:TolC family protein [Shewanella sp. 10N.286.52.C2]PMG29021.1 transporter [Shewanella sp. 10N.286.52.C2]PMG52168.1 transporter [Shewanella sp. 10N.286.52.B9]PMH87474.1 transporter [Shewanella sp. 10N.286.48.B5]